MDKFLLSFMMLMMFLMPANAASITTSEWTKVASSSDFDPNARYILVSGTAICSYTTNSATSSYLKPCVGTVIDKSGVISSIPEDAAIFTFPTYNATDKSTVVLLSNYDGVAKGYYNTTTAKKMQLKTAESEGTKATVNIDNSGNALIAFSSTVGTIYYNTGSPRFLNYASKQAYVTLYKEKAAGPAKPTISFDDITKQVSITAEEGASIFYTTDNTEPTADSTPYNGSFPISKTTTVKAIAVKDGNKSETAELLCPVPENAFVEVDSNMTDWVRVGESVEVKFTASPAAAAQYVVITTGNPDIKIEKNAEGKWMLTGVKVNEYIEYSLKFADGCGYVDINDTPISGVVEVVPGRPVADPAPGEDGFINIKEGDTITFSCDGAEKIFVLQDEDVPPSYDNPHTVTFPTIGDYVVSVFPVKGENKTYEDKYGLIEGFKIKVAEKPAVTTTTFELVKNGETFEDGDKVLVAYQKNGTYYAMTNSTANSKITAKAVTVTNNVITLEDGQTDYGVLTVMEGTDANAGKFALKGSEGYVNGSSSNTNTSFGTTAYYSTVTFPTKNADNVKWYIQSDRYILGYNGTDFRGYKNDQTGQPIYIFRAVVNPISFAAKAGSHYLHEDNSAWDGYLGFSNPKNLPVTVTSSDEYVASVNDLGEVFPKHVGTTVITATATKGEGENMKTYTASYTLSVGLDGTIGEGEVAIPAVYDAYENFYKSSDFEIFDTQYLLVEHLPGYTLHYSYVRGNEHGTTGKENAPARAAAEETTDMHDVVEGTDRTAIKIYPYGKELDNPYNGTITVWAEKDGMNSAERTIAIGVPTGVEGIEADGADGAEYYTLQGVRVANPDKGVYIRVLNGKAVKVAL